MVFEHYISFRFFRRLFKSFEKILFTKNTFSKKILFPKSHKSIKTFPKTNHKNTKTQNKLLKILFTKIS